MYTGDFGPIPNSADWTEVISVLSTDDDAEAPALTEITMRIGGCLNIVKTMTGGDITYDDEEGEFTFTVPQSEMLAISPNTYPMGIVIETADAIEQLFAGTFTVIDGVVI